MRILTLARASTAAAVLLVGTTAALAAPASRNLLANPDFEQPLEGHAWMPAGWDTSESEVPTAFFGRDTFLSERGRYAISVANVSTLVPMAHNWNQAVLVGREAWGKDAVLTVWTRSNGLQERAFILLQAYRDTVTKMSRIWKMPRDDASKRLQINKIDDPLLDLGWARQAFDEHETGWVKRSVRVFVPPSVNVLWVRLGLTGTGQVLFDDVSLTLEPARRPVAPPLGTNLLNDPGFEGDGLGWEYGLPPYENTKVVKDTTAAHSGRACIRIESPLSGMVKVRTGVGQVFPNRALAGKRVRLSGYVRTDSLRGGAGMLIYAHTLSGPKMQPVPREYSMNTPWELGSTEMDLPPDTYEVWVWFAYQAPARGRVFFDDCSFEVLGPAAAPAKPAAARPASKR